MNFQINGIFIHFEKTSEGEDVKNITSHQEEREWKQSQSNHKHLNIGNRLGISLKYVDL